MGAWWRDGAVWWLVARAAAVVAVAAGVVGVLVWQLHAEATEPDAGWVTEKVLHPEWESESCQTVNGVQQCRETEYDEWYEVRYCDDDGACGDAEVSWARYETVQVGQWFEQ